MTRAQDDEAFDFDRYVQYVDGPMLQVRKHSWIDDPNVVIDDFDGEIYIRLTLDEAEALAYRLLYAVKRIKEDTDG